MKAVIFLMLLSILGMDGGQPPKDWTDWVLEGKALRSAGNYLEAAQAFRNALASTASAPITDRQLIGVHDALAGAYAEAAQYAEAEHEYRRALSLAEKTQGRQSLEYALLIAEWTILPTRTDDNEDTIPLLTEALAKNRANASWRDLASIQSCLAELLIHQRRFAEAEPLLLQVKADLEGRKDASPEVLAYALSGLGLLRFEERRYAEAVELYRESINVLELAKGSGHPSLLLLLNGLAASYARMGQLDDSDLVYRRALAVCRNTLGDDHLTCAVLLQNFGVVLRKLGRKSEGKNMVARGREIEHAAMRRAGAGSIIRYSNSRNNTEQ
jgi:tetratricopeptide (TPR) repeat protein